MSRDRTVGDTFFIAFTTRAFATGIPTVLAGSPVISAYEDAGLTQITAGITLGVSHDGVVGMNMLTIVATGANGYESGKDYQLAITTGTVGGVSVVGEIIGQFSLGLSAAAVDLANGTDGLGALKSDTAATLVDTADMQPKVAKIPLSDGTITWNSTALGSVNAECDTAISDASLATAANLATVDTNVDSILVDTAEIGVAGAGLTDITLNAASIDLVWDEVLTGATHNVTNSSGRRLRQISGQIFTDGTAQSGGNNAIQLAAGDVTADNQFVRAKVLIISGTGSGQEAIITDSVASTDTLTITPAWLTNPDATSEYEVVPAQVHTTVQNGGYENASIYVDTVNGVAGTLSGVNGTSTNPVDSLTDAFVIATANNLITFHILAGSTITMPADSSNREFIGHKYSVLLNSADINNTLFDGAESVTGIGDCATTAASFFTCGMGAVTIDPCNGFRCGFFGTFTMRSAGVFIFGTSVASVPGVSLIVDYGSGLNASQWSLPQWGGGTIEVQNMGAGTGSYSMEASGFGDFIINANCSATSAVDLHGHFTLVNNASGITLTQDTNYEESILVNAVLDEALSGHTTAGSLGKAVTDIETDVTAVLVDTGTTLDTKLNDIQGGTFSSVTDSLEAIRDRGDAAWTTGAGGNDRLLMADTTIATLATQTSFTLTAGSADNDAYNNLSIVIEDVSTSTQKAVGMVLDYVGSTKTVTLKEALAFTIATTDKVYILAENSLKSTVANRQLDVTATGAAGIDWGNIENKTTANDLSATDIQLVDTCTTLTGHTVQTGDSFARLGAPAGASLSADIADLPTVAEFNARTLAAAGYFDPAADTVANVTLVATTTTNTDMVGTDGANTVVPPSVAQFNARTILSASYFDPAADTVALVTTTTNVTNQVTANVTAISGDSAAADSLEASLETLVTGTATGVPTTTTMADSTLTEATDDHYNGRVIIWRTGALAQQATDITSYNGTTKTFTFTATTNAASAGDAYVIV